MNIRDAFTAFSAKAAGLLGSPWLFVANVVLIIVWLASGPFFHFSDTWQLLVNTATTVITYLAVFLIQNTQNRDAKAVHIKLDELISSLEGARNRFVSLENATDEELAEQEKEFRTLHELADRGKIEPDKAVIEEIDQELKKKIGPKK